MKKVIHIASALLLVSLFSCQKEEFQDIYEQKEDVIHARMTTPSASDKTNTVSSESIYTPDSQSSASRKDNREVINVMVKEISDGDDEADGGDDSRERE